MKAKGIKDSNNTLSINRINPRYFTDKSGKAIYLTGSHTWYNIHSETNKPIPSYEDFENYLDFLQSHNHNFLRLWTGFSYLEQRPHPWKRTGPGSAVDGGLKFDMNNFNQDYFDMLRERILQIQMRGMYCSVMLFGSHNRMKSNFQDVTWHPFNNINAALAEAFDVNNGYSFFTTHHKALEIQRKLVRKFIDSLNDVDNLIWEIMNEPGGRLEAVRWHKEMIDYVKSYESSKPKQHLVGMGGGWQLYTQMLSSSADWISPDWDEYLQGGPANYSDKIAINDTDHMEPWGGAKKSEAENMRKWVWKTFLRGNHPIFMDSYIGYLPEIDKYGAVEHAFDLIRDTMGYTRAYADKMNLAKTVPSDDGSICSTKYCLYTPGIEYLIYQPITGSPFMVNLSAGTYTYEWFNPVSGSVSDTGTLTVGSGKKTFTAPFSGDGVLYLSRIS
jgi:inhibitor of KinA sporulation pathway (predicted exonuclease)